jgi:hypothetical protein
MKTLLVLAISTLLPMLCGAADTNGFLVFKIKRDTYSTKDGKSTEPEIKQSFKIPLTPEFLSNFKNLPNQNSQGTGFVCTSDFEKPGDNAPHFMWWLERTSERRWYIHMWSSWRNPSATQSVTIKNLEDLDMSYQDSYVNIPKGVNDSFSVKFMSAEQIAHEGLIPMIPVKKADRSVLFPGDSLTNCPVVLSGLFQEN